MTSYTHDWTSPAGQTATHFNPRTGQYIWTDETEGDCRFVFRDGGKGERAPHGIYTGDCIKKPEYLIDRRTDRDKTIDEMYKDVDGFLLGDRDLCEKLYDKGWRKLI